MAKEKITNEVLTKQEQELEQLTQDILEQHKDELELIGATFLKDTDDVFTQTFLKLLQEFLNITHQKAQEIISTGARMNDEMIAKGKPTEKEMAEIPSKLLKEVGILDSTENKVRWRLANSYMFQLMDTVSK